MNALIIQLKQKALSLIKDPSISDATTLARLGPIPAKLFQLENQMQEIENELARIAGVLDGYSNPKNPATHEPHASNGGEVSHVYGVRGERRKIRIEVDWSMLGLPGGKEVICEHMVSDSYVKFLSRLYEVKGVSVLEKLAQLKINRGMFASRNPADDYRNGNDPLGKPFQSQPISNSGFFALTHSSTDEKIINLRKACRHLGLPIGVVTVSDV